MNNDILTSIALFSELYKNNQKDILHIVAEFIKATIQAGNILVFNDVDIYNGLNKYFSITIPKSVIKYTLKNKLSEIISKDPQGQYVVSSKFRSDNNFEAKQKQLQESYNDIFSHLYQYISTIQEKDIDQIEKENIKKEFINFLLKKDSPVYSDIFTAFTIQNKFKDNFIQTLNLVTEGVVVYSGIQYSTPEELKQLGKWKTGLTIYLDTEQLFNCTGYNDEYYKQIFDDFHSLINEINQGNKTRLLHLKYFIETQKEIDVFFGTAEQIIEGKAQLNPSKIAMVNILKDCKDIFDVKVKKTEFYRSLQQLGIQLDEDTKVKDIWNIGSQNILCKVEHEMQRKKYEYDEAKTVSYLSIFSKINSLRNGINNAQFEQIKYIFLSANGFVRYLSCFDEIRQESGIPFTTDIDFITSRLWFKLQKGFSNGNTPLTFDVIARSQLVLVSQYVDSVNKKYEELLEKKLSPEAKIDIYNDLRIHGTITASSVSPDILPEIISFINQPSINHLLQEKSITKNKLEEAEVIKNEYAKTIQEKVNIEKERDILKEGNSQLLSENKAKDRIYRNAINTPLKRKIRGNINLIFCCIHFLLILIIILLIFSIYVIISPNDTYLTIIVSILTILLAVLPFFKKYRSTLLIKAKKNSIEKFKRIMSK